MAKFDEVYLEGIRQILNKGRVQKDPNRAGTTRLNIPSYTIRHNIADGLPALTIRKISPMLAWAELSMFISGSTDIRDLWCRGVNFWDADYMNYQGIDKDALKSLKSGQTLQGNFDMGKIYPHQYRRFGGSYDQIDWLITELSNNPMSSRMVVSAWNPNDILDACLPSCHHMFQVIGFEINGGVGFEVHFSMRSSDYYLGVPYNCLYYTMLGMLLEALTGHKFIGIQGDLKNVHLYDNAIEPAKYLLTQTTDISPPTAKLVGDLDINRLSNSNIEVSGYKNLGSIKVNMKPYSR